MTERRVAALTMSYRSPPLLAKWVDHYGGMLGRENTFVISHGRDDRQEAVAGGSNYISLPRREFDARIAVKKANILRDFCSFLLNTYSAVICGDVDELVIAHPDLETSLEDYIHTLPADAIVAPVGLNIMPRSSYFDLERPADIASPLLRQCNRVSLASNFCKPAVVKRTPRFAPGNHWLLKDTFTLDTNLVLIHTKFLALNGASFYESMACNVQEHAEKTGILRHRLWVQGLDGLRKMTSKLEQYDDQRVSDPKDEASRLHLGPVSDTNPDLRVLGPKLGQPFRLEDKWLDLV